MLSFEDNIEDTLYGIGTKRRLGFLDSLLVHHIKNPEEFTELDIRAEVDTFMVGGHDTIATACQFALLLIGHDPKIQVKY